jgi:hypothetical protein
MIQRVVDVEFAPGIVLPRCTAEDLFVMKVFAERARDEQDARSIAARTRTLDHAYIYGQLQELGDVTETRDEMLRTAGAILEVNR